MTGKTISRETGERPSDPAERGVLRYFYRDWHPTRFGRMWSRAFAWASGLGLTPQILTTLQVENRYSGRLTSTVLVAANHKGRRYLVSMLGEGSEWVQDVRAAKGTAFVKRRQTWPVTLTEVPFEERAPVLKAWCQVATSGRRHLPVSPDAPLEAFEEIAVRYPVFRVDPVEQQKAHARPDASTATLGPRNRVVQVRRFGGPDGLEVVDTPLPSAGKGEVRVRVLASSLNYTDTLIRRHMYPQTAALRPPFVLGYDVVGEIDQLGKGVTGFALGARVADMTVVGSNAAYCTLRANHLARVPAGLDAAEAATLILSWTTAWQLLHRAARVQRGQRVLVQGAAGAVGQALLALGRLAGVEMWGTARPEHAALIRALGATPIDYQREDFTRVLHGGFDVVIDGVGEDGYRRSFAALKRGGLLCAIGYSAAAQEKRRMLMILMWIARLYLWRWLPGGKRARFYSINAMRARHPGWFAQDLERLFALLAEGTIHPRVTERISFDEVAEAHRRLEKGGLEGKLVLCPDLVSRGPV